MSPATTRWSLTGKMPSAGDFLRRNLSAATASRIDDWLDVELSRRAADDEEDWVDRFAAGGRCRFRLGENVLGTEPAHGVIAPSRDAVGRGYALVVFTPAPIATRDADACVARALTQAASADELLAWLDAAPGQAFEAGEPPASGSGFWARDADEDDWRLMDGLPRGDDFDLLFAPPALEASPPDAGAQT